VRPSFRKPENVVDSRFRVVFRTGRVYELDVAQDTLRDAGIPSYAQEEGIGGLVTALPSSPVAGPGVWFNVLVPEERLADARNALSDAPLALALDLDSEPGVGHFDPGRRWRATWRIYAAVVLLISVAIGILELIRNL
jgi:hypothetical protein